MQQPSGDQGYQAKPMGRKSCLQKPDLTLNQLMLWGITPAHLDNPPAGIPLLWSHSQLGLGPELSVPPLGF